MDLENIPTHPRDPHEFHDIYRAFLKAVNEKNEDLINSIISIDGILLEEFAMNKESLLNIVAEQGTVETAAKMIQLGLHINAQNKSDDTPIYYAIRNSADMVKLFLNHGASLNVKFNKRISPLQEALSNGSEETVQVILSKMIVDIQNKNKSYSISLQNSEEVLKALLQHKWNLHLQVEDYPGLIFFAARTGNAELLNLTLDDCRKYLNSIKGKKRKRQSKEACDPRLLEELNFQGRFKNTALHYAVKQQLPEVVRFLLKAGANVNCKSDLGFTPLHYAAIFENLDICKILLSFAAEVNPTSCDVGLLYLVCGRVENLKYMISTGRKDYDRHFLGTSWLLSNYFDNSDATFNLPVMKFLLQNKVNPDIPGQKGMLPLFEACRTGHIDALKLLIDFNANVEMCDKDGNSALHYAALSNNSEIVDILLHKGLDIKIENSVGYSPLLFTLEERNKCLEMIEHLADRGADINSRSFGGCTALQIAAYFNWSDVIECLLAMGADIRFSFGSETEDNYYRSYPIHLENGHLHIIAFNAIKQEKFSDFIEHSDEGQYAEEDVLQLKQARADYFRKCKIDLEKMKLTKIVENRGCSFYDFLTSNFRGAIKIIKSNEAKKAFTDKEYKEDFPCYERLLRERFQRMVSLEKAVDETVDFMEKFGTIFNLPILVVDKILSFFGPKDFRIIGRSLSRRRL